MLDSDLISINRMLVKLESGLTKGETKSLAEVNIQNMLREIANRSDVEINSMRSIDVAKPEEVLFVHEEYPGISIKITFRSSIEQLREILYRIETSAKLIEISQMRLRIGKSEKKGMVMIKTTLTIEGYMKNNDKENE